MRELSLFTGAGGGVLGSKLLGWTTIGYVEYDKFCQKLLKQRIADGILDAAPIFGDIRAFISEGYAEAYQGMVDVVSGGFPCQDISCGNPKAKGIDGERSGLWSCMSECIGKIRPKFALIENSPMLISRGLDKVLCDLAQMGYNARWGCIGANFCGANHQRKRIWIVASDPYQSNACGEPRPKRKDICTTKWTDEKIIKERKRWEFELGAVDIAQRISTYSDAVRVLHGMADRNDRLAALGNGQVPIVAKTAWELLGGNHDH